MLTRWLTCGVVGGSSASDPPTCGNQRRESTMSYDPDFTKSVHETAPLSVPRWPQRDRSIFGLGNPCCGAEQGRDDLSGVEEVRLRH